ncbi:MAG: hypothetical protein WCH76_00205 [Candidatus Riflemargulisbacteria bacterium]
MKKLVFLSLVVFSLGIFATEVTAKTAGSWGINLRQAASQNILVDKTYTDASYKIGDSTVFASIRWDKIVNATSLTTAKQALDYLWVETMIGNDTLRFGIQRLGMGNYGKGIPQTTPFLTAVVLKAAGVSYATKLEGFPTKIFLAQSAFFLDDVSGGDTKGAIGVLVDTKMGSKVGFIYQNSRLTDISGSSVYADYVTSLLGTNLQFQIFYDLSDDAVLSAVNNTGAVVSGVSVPFSKARRLLNIAADMPIQGIGTVYGYFFKNLNEDNDSKLMAQYAIGLEYTLSKTVNFVVEVSENDNSTAGKTQSAKAALEFEI